jgi:hypothetical protein
MVSVRLVNGMYSVSLREVLNLPESLFYSERDSERRDLCLLKADG